ncbi:MAG: RNB domain-containing ribonuclease, partial [Desulfobacterales bacterium]|nr:RNB domain-containing ribonuclease [Desulfobacterales bacterium]
LKKQKLRLLTETNREVAISARRLLNQSDIIIDLSKGRNNTVGVLRDIAKKRELLSYSIDIKELWETLNKENAWIDLPTITELCFPDNSSSDHESAVMRTIFNNRQYFKFKNDRFFPNTEEQVEINAAREQEMIRRGQIIKEGGDWLKRFFDNYDPSAQHPIFDEKDEVLQIMKSYYLFGKDSKHAELCKAILNRAEIEDPEILFGILLKTGVFKENENIDLYRYHIRVPFPDKAEKAVSVLVMAGESASSLTSFGNERKDLTHLSLMTIDGASTLDFDDAISLEDYGDFYKMGVHITDVGHFLRKGNVIDEEAAIRGSSIYMPDQKIPMLPDQLGEGLCSLIAGKQRPAISIMIKLNRSFEILQYEVIPSIIKVENQYTYHDVNLVADSDLKILILHQFAEKFRQKRIGQGAVHIALPEINVWIDNEGDVSVNRINRESPARMFVSEIMILANWCMARFLMENNIPAIYRSQASPRQRLFQGTEGTLFQNYMQRRMLSRLILRHQAERHSGLGLDAYITCTSPIRKYMDLVNQRQIRAVFGLEEAYSIQELGKIIHILESPMGYVQKIQNNRNKYWILKYLEGRIGKSEEAVVLQKRKSDYQVLLKDHMIECDLPYSGYIDLKPADLVQVKLQYVNARKDVVSILMA